MSYESPFPIRSLPSSLVVSDFDARLDRLMGGRVNGPRLIGLSEHFNLIRNPGMAPQAPHQLRKSSPKESKD